MELPAMFTHVPDASAPTRLSALSDVPAIKSAAEFSAAFFICPKDGDLHYKVLSIIATSWCDNVLFLTGKKRTKRSRHGGRYENAEIMV